MSEEMKMEWQDIESSPRDGSEFLCYWKPFGGDPQIVVARWQDERYMPWVGLYAVNAKQLDGRGSIARLEGGFPEAKVLATHWMPLPEPPTAETAI